MNQKTSNRPTNVAKPVYLSDSDCHYRELAQNKRTRSKPQFNSYLNYLAPKADLVDDYLSEDFDEQSEINAEPRKVPLLIESQTTIDNDLLLSNIQMRFGLKEKLIWKPLIGNKSVMTFKHLEEDSNSLLDINIVPKVQFRSRISIHEFNPDLPPK